MVTYNSGQRVDKRTHAMLEEAEARSGAPVVVVQGSYSKGKFSAGTHSGGGAADIRVWNMTTAQRNDLVLWLRKVGFAAWYRYDVGSGPHIHAIAIGCKDLHPSAAAQVTAYKNGRDGLARNWKDDGPRVKIVTWEEYKKEMEVEDVLNKEDREWIQKAIIAGVKAAADQEVLEALATPRGQALLANGVAKALRDGTVVRREFIELIGEGLRDPQSQALIGNALAAALRDGWVVRREVEELVENATLKNNNFAQLLKKALNDSK